MSRNIIAGSITDSGLLPELGWVLDATQNYRQGTRLWLNIFYANQNLSSGSRSKLQQSI